MAQTLYWYCLPFADLDNEILYRIIALRNEVFVVEQDCVYQDADFKDLKCHHVYAVDDAGEVVAYTRIVPPGISYTEPALGRIVTSPKVRRTGVGKELMRRSMQYLWDIYGPSPIRISAQEYLQRFYEDFGFQKIGEGYLEDNIPHIEMLKV